MIKKIIFTIILIFSYILLSRDRSEYPKISTKGGSDSPQKESVSHKTEDEKVNYIKLVGNKKTKDYIILREMLIKIGDAVDSSKIEIDRKRIENLGIFNRVEISRFEDTLLVEVTEQWYILPIFYFDVKEHNFNKLSYGGGITWLNFRGRNEQLTFAGLFGYNPQFFIRYTNPWILDDKKIYIGTTLYKAFVANKSTFYSNFQEEWIGGSLNLGKRFGYYLHTNLDIEYHVVELDSDFKNLTLSKNGTDKLPILRLKIRYDTRDFFEYPHMGSHLYFWIEKKGFPNSAPEYSFYGFDLRRYFPVNSSTLATRWMINISKNKVPIYDRNYWGYTNKIRGHFYKIFEGENIMGGEIELRFPIYKVRYFSWEDAPIFKEYYKNLKFGVNGAIFTDTGIVWFQKEKIKLQNFNSGIGVGMHIILPYNNLIRIEYAFNEKFRGEFIFDLKLMF
jgi:outer membrane protein assembly factor BamA